MRHIVWKASILAVFVGGCASTGVPLQRITASQSAIRAAEEAGAEKVPSASLHLKLAREQVAKAKVYMNDGDDDEANRLLARAQADAELAIVLAREATARVEAERVMNEVATLRARIR